MEDTVPKRTEAEDAGHKDGDLFNDLIKISHDEKENVGNTPSCMKLLLSIVEDEKPLILTE